MRTDRIRHRAPRELSEPAPRVAANAPAAPLMVGAQERARRRLVNVVLVIYMLAILEGAIRKYVAPQLGQYIFFIRDPFLLYAYLLASRHALWPRGGAFFGLSVGMCVFGLLLLVLQFATGGHSEHRLLLGVYGWRTYFLYVPLVFLVGTQFGSADLARFGRITMWLAIPIALLVVLQFFAPVNSAINVGVSEEKELQFQGMGLTAEHVRTTGPFTSTAGLQQFVVTACGFVLAFLLRPAAQRGIGFIPLMAAAASVLTCIGLSGSRGTLAQCVLTGLFALAIGLIGRGVALKSRALTLPTALGVTGVLLYPIVFPAGFAAFMARWESAAANETHVEYGLVGRALYGFVDFTRLIEVVPPLGYGLGFGSNASILLRATVDGVRPGAFVETDFARHMVDLGAALGMGYIAFRVALAIWLGRLVLAATRRVSDPLPMMLFAFAGYTLLLGQISGNGTINVYGWLFAGLCLAAARNALQSSASTAGSVPRVQPAAVSRGASRALAWRR